MQDKVRKIIENTENGNTIILDSFLELKQIKAVLEGLLDDIKEFNKTYITEINNEAMDYPEGYKGFDIKLVSGRKTFSFKNITEWTNIDVSKKEIEKKYKDLFSVYQSTNERPMSEDGVVYDLPEINYTSDYFKVTKSKKL
jgi:hypothetical protein